MFWLLFTSPNLSRNIFLLILGATTSLVLCQGLQNIINLQIEKEWNKPAIYLVTVLFSLDTSSNFTSSENLLLTTPLTPNSPSYMACFDCVPITCFVSICLFASLFHKYMPGVGCKESACSAGDAGLIPRLGRSPEEGNGNPLQYSCLGKCMNRQAWRATVHGVAKESDMI